jgi:cytochrome c-type biogenesis protein CcmH
MSRGSSRSLPALLALVVFLASAAAHAASPQDEQGAAVTGATALETRLFAPCCWTQTLDVHESELSSSLRAEIRRRLRAGETADSIEEDLVARYGERIRAVQKGRDTRGVAPVVTGVAALLGAVGLFSWIRRRTRRGPEELAPEARSPVEDEYDELVDDELRRLDA